jgi:hypothetical protein
MTPGELMQTVVDALVKGDIRPLAVALDDHVIWKSAATTRRSSLPFGGSYIDKASVMEHLVRIATGYNFNQIAILDITSKGEACSTCRGPTRRKAGRGGRAGR